MRRFITLLTLTMIAGNSVYGQEKSEVTAVLSEYTLDKPQGSYTPSFKVDGSNAKVRNVILLIGDGMGLGASGSAYFANGKKLTMFNLKTVGFVCTQPVGNFTTDSAASGTAYATGEKTNNGKLGVDTEGNILKNLTEKIAPAGYACGVISTDNLHGATPAAFFSHQSSRANRDSIWKDLYASSLTFVSAGTKAVFDKLPLSTKESIEKTFTVIYDADEAALNNSERLCYLPESMDLDKRGDYLPATTASAIDYLKSRGKKGFFLMVEGGRIDHGVHSNDAKKTVRETLDFDKAVEAAVRFAEKDGHTLVIVTSDHETGNAAVRWADPEENTVRTLFGIKGHSGMMVPLFAYGPGSGLFTGMQENSDVGNRIFTLLSPASARGQHRR